MATSYAISLAAKKLAPHLTRVDTTGILSSIPSPVYFAYQPGWGRLSTEQEAEINSLIVTIDDCISSEKEEKLIDNLVWLRACYHFTLLLDEVSVALEPAWLLREEHLSALNPGLVDESRKSEAVLQLTKAPIEEMLRVFSSRVRSRGELGELSSLIQRVWNEYQLLSEYLETEL